MNNFIIVLGMHRSATSLTAMLLSKMNTYAGKKQELLEADPDNPRGFYELLDAIHIDDNILYENASLWNEIQDHIPTFSTSRSDEIYSIVKHLKETSDKDNLLLKDPRMCLLEPLWRKEIQKLGYGILYIIVLRHPFEVASSLYKRDGMCFEYGLKLWYFYNLTILKSVMDTNSKNVLFINHNLYYENPVIPLKKLIEFSGEKKPYQEYLQYIDLGLRHNKKESLNYNCHNELYGTIFDLYQYMEKCCKNSLYIKEFPYKKYEDDLKTIANTSYAENNYDMTNIAVKNTKTYALKEWCIFQLTNKKEDIRRIIKKYAKALHVKKISVYGNGTIAERLYPVLNELYGYSYAIYDKTSKVSVTLCGEIITPVKFNTYEGHSEELIINTVVYHEDEIYNIVSRVLLKQMFISVFDIIYNALKFF